MSNMHPVKFFDQVSVLNLPERTDRLRLVKDQMHKYRIHAGYVPSMKNENGQQGVYDTLAKVFRRAIAAGKKSVLIFEDDVSIVNVKFNSIIFAATKQLPEDWQMLYLGANLPNPNLVTRYSPNLLLTKRALALHAVAYSKSAMEMILSLPKMLPIDLQIASFVHPIGKTFVTYPLLCTQMDSISDIEKEKNEEGVLVGKKTKNDFYITPRYKKVCEHLNLKYE